MLSADFAPHGPCCELCVAPVVASHETATCLTCNRAAHQSCLAYVLPDLVAPWRCSNCRHGAPDRNADPNLALQRGLARVRNTPKSYAEDPSPKSLPKKKPRIAAAPAAKPSPSVPLQSQSPPPPPRVPTRSTSAPAAAAADDAWLSALSSLAEVATKSPRMPAPAPFSFDHAAAAAAGAATAGVGESTPTGSAAPAGRTSTTRKRSKGMALPTGSLMDASGRRVLLKLHLADHSPPPGHPKSFGSSRFKGVCLKKGRWVTQISHEGHQRYVGSYDSEGAAALAYANAAMDTHFVGPVRAAEAVQEGAAAFASGASASVSSFWVNIGIVNGVEHWVLQPGQANLTPSHFFDPIVAHGVGNS